MQKGILNLFSKHIVNKQNNINVFKSCYYMSTNKNYEKNDKPQKTKYESVTYKEGGQQSVVDYKNMLYQPTTKLEFDITGRCLLYFYRPRFYTYTMMYTKYIIPIAYVAKLIPNNPFYLSYPITLPLMCIFEIWAVSRIIRLKSFLRRVISEIYLHKDGQTLEIVYQNQLWKKMKDISITELFFIPSLKTPVINERMKPLKGDLFPEQYPFKELKQHGYAWTKYYRNPQNYMVIPKYANYIDTETLIAALSGQIIEINKQTSVDIDYEKKEKYIEV